MTDILTLKHQLKGMYKAKQILAAGVDCGHELHKTISAPYSQICQAINATLDELALIDPDTPKVRF